MSRLIYARGKKIRNHPYDIVWESYRELYHEKYGNYPEINYAACGRLIKERLKNHSLKGLIKIVELFFEGEKNPSVVFDLKAILSTYFINKYAPKLKLDPEVYSNAKEWNKDTY